MKRPPFALLPLVALGGLGACAPGDPPAPVYPTVCADPAGCFVPPFRLVGLEDSDGNRRTNQLPFPYDYFSVEDPGTRTGRRLRLLEPGPGQGLEVNTRLVDPGLAVVDRAGFVAALHRQDGFAAFASLLVETGEALRADVLPAGAATDGPVRLVDLDPDSPTRGQPVPLHARLLEACEPLEGAPGACARAYPYLLLRPAAPLRPSGRYAVVVTRALRSADDRPPVMPLDFQEVWGLAPIDPARPGARAREAERVRLAPLRAELEALGSPPTAELVLAYDLTVQSATHELERLAAAVRARPPAVPDLDPDRDGEPNAAPPGAWPAHLPALPGADPTHVGLVAAGELPVPEFRHRTSEAHKNEPGYFALEFDPDGSPRVAGENRLAFWAWYPRDARQPMPVVLLQHGIGAEKEQMARLVGAFAERGVAVLAFDFPFHGTRRLGDPSFEFVDIMRPTKARTSFQQAAAEHVAILRALSGGGFDAWPDGRGDGLADFDPGRVGYLGNSLGAIVGATSLALSEDVRAGVLVVGGAGLQDFLDAFLVEWGLGDFYPEHVVRQVALIVQLLLDGGDPVNFLALQRARHAAGEFQVLALQAMQDETIPAVLTENLARHAGLTQVEPVQAPFQGLARAEAPFTGGMALYQYGAATHNLVLGGSDTGARARAQAAEFLRSSFESPSGQATVIDPFQ
jgi:dienelactone hydrolase